MALNTTNNSAYSGDKLKTDFLNGSAVLDFNQNSDISAESELYNMTGSLVLFLSTVMTIHYANTPVQYTAILHGCKNVHFQIKFLIIFLIFAQNIDCGYTFEPPQ